MNHAAFPFEAALQHLVPGRAHERLLAACLLTGDTAHRAWLDFADEVHDPKAHFEMERGGLKGLLPFVEAGLTRNGIDPGKTFLTYTRVARVREELRSRIYGDILGAVLDQFHTAEVSPVLIKGGALSATVYPQPSVRHNHAIDLLVGAAEMVAAARVLSRAAFTLREAGSGAAAHQTYRHRTGLALGLHSTPLFLPHFEMPLAAVHARTRTVPLDGRVVRVMSAEDSLVHVCGHVAYSRSRKNLRWVCDVFYLLTQNPGLNWQLVIETAIQSRVALPLLVLLRWVNRVLMAPVPAEALDDLNDRTRTIDSATAEGLYTALLHTGLSRGDAVRCFGTNWTTQFEFLKFNVLPSPRYMRWRHNVNAPWKLPFYYADRPRRVIQHLLHTRRSPQTATEDSIVIGGKEGGLV